MPPANLMMPHRRATVVTCLLTALIVIASTLLVAPEAQASGGSWYVAPYGDDDGAGTINDPWRTIHLSMLKVSAGDTLYLRGGEYRERIGNLKPLPRGTSSAPITLTSAPGEAAVIRGGMTLQLGGAHYWIFDGLTFAWDSSLGKNAALVRMVDGFGWQIRNSHIGGNHSYTALRVMAETQGLAANWSIEDNCITNTYATNATNNDHNVYVGADSRFGVAPGGGVIANNIISGAPNGSNIKLGGGEPDLPGTSGVTIRDNVLAEAPHNVVIAWRSHDNLVENNITFQRPNGSWSQPWYPNIRGLDLTGSGNVARGNLGFNDGGVVGSWHSPAPVQDLGNTNTTFNPSVPEDACKAFAAWVGGADEVLSEGGAARVSGASRTKTAVQLAREVYDRASTVIVARADEYADALAGSPLAGWLNAPLLLTNRDSLTPETAAAIRDLGATQAYLMGGTSALSTAVEDSLIGMGLNVRRLAGADRFATAVRVLEELPPTNEVYVVEGTNADPSRGWPDAVALSPLAARTSTPILLTASSRLPAATAQALRSLANDVAVTIVGGRVAVTDEVADVIRATAPTGQRSVHRLAGRSRFETSALIGHAAVAEGAKPDDVWLVTGQNWPDALAAGPAAAAAGSTMLLAHGQRLDLSAVTTTWVADNVPDPSEGLTIIGGAGAISPFAITEMLYGMR